MGASGKSVEVLGGRTTRPSARKIRSNKVHTTKGLRDRRVRLSADTAIQFYDVQDRLGYERATEAIDWLIEKAKGSIDMLFDTSSQHYAHLVHQGDINGLQDGYHAENLSSRGEFEESVYVQNFYSPGYHSENISECNFMGSSGVFPHVHMPNNAPDLSYRMSLKPYRFEDSGFHSASSSILKHGSMSRFDSKLNFRSEKDEPVSNTAPMLLKSPADDSNYDLSLAHSTNGVNITSVQCLAPAYEPADRGLLSDQVPNLYNSTQSRQYQEQLVEANHPFFPVPASRNINGSTIGI